MAARRSLAILGTQPAATQFATAEALRRQLYCHRSQIRAYVVCFGMELIKRDDGTIAIYPRMAARERGVCAGIGDYLQLGHPVTAVFCGGKTGNISVSQSSINATAVRRSLGELAQHVTFVLDEQSSNTLENIVEAWKIIGEDSRSAERVPITFVTDISHIRAQVIPNIIFRDARYERYARSESFEKDLYDRIDSELRGLHTALEALRRCDPHFELAPEIYRQIVAGDHTPTRGAITAFRPITGFLP